MALLDDGLRVSGSDGGQVLGTLGAVGRGVVEHGAFGQRYPVGERRYVQKVSII